MTSRPVVSVYKSDNAKEIADSVAMPGVFTAPIRNDLVHFVHSNLAKNRRQGHAVFYKAGAEHSAESWGTGRAVARIPRISGSGTSRSGQATFGNMCRKARMFAPLKIWRKWHRKVNVNQRRNAVASALAASACVPLVMASGAGSEVRNAMGVTVFTGMIGVTLFGLLLTPVFYVALRKLAKNSVKTHPETNAHTPGIETGEVHV